MAYLSLRLQRNIRRYIAATFFCLVFFFVFYLAKAHGQTAISYPNAPSTAASSVSNGNAAAIGQSSFSGSVPEGKATSEVLSLTLTGAIERGLRNNLGLLLQGDATMSAHGEKWKELSELLPHVTTTTGEHVVQENLAALGIRGPGFPTIVGPFAYFDIRAFLTQSVVDFKAINRNSGASENEKAAQFSYKDARDIVVLAVGNAYLQGLADAARIETAEAQNQTAKALFDKSTDQQKAGVVPAIDTLRANVEYQNRQLQLIVARNDFAKQKLALGRVIGLPPGQEFILADKIPYQPLTNITLDEALQRAYVSRSDYLAAEQQVKAAEHFRKAATAEYFPSLNIAGDYGIVGINPSDSHGTFDVAGTLKVPVFEGGKTHADVLQAEATLRQSRSQLDNLRGQIDYEVRSALLDLAAAAEQVEVARSSVDLAQQTLEQARDRFSAGVSDNLEVVQAQESVAAANENYISSLYSHNLAKVALARVMGFAEEGVKQYLKSQ